MAKNKTLDAILESFTKGIKNFANKYEAKPKEILLKMYLKDKEIVYEVLQNKEGVITFKSNFKLANMMPAWTKLLPLNVDNLCSSYILKFFNKVELDHKLPLSEIKFVVKCTDENAENLKAYLYRGSKFVIELPLSYIMETKATQNN